MSIFDKAKEMLNTEKGEQISDQLLDKAADLAKTKLGEDKAQYIDTAREKLDEQFGVAGAEAPAGAPAEEPATEA